MVRGWPYDQVLTNAEIPNVLAFDIGKGVGVVEVGLKFAGLEDGGDGGEVRSSI
jgi:hypothetical protein